MIENLEDLSVGEVIENIFIDYQYWYWQSINEPG